MTNIQTIHDEEDLAPLYLPHSLYLKPLARMNISVALPGNKTGKSISNLDITEKLGAALKPDKFFTLKVLKSTLEFIRFDAELDKRSRLRAAISRLDGASLKISGFSQQFRVRAREAKDEFPTRHDWDTFFRDAGNMDEMKAGERPDTIHFTHLPIRWFCPRHSENEENVKPSESIFKRIFEKFGCVRAVDIPICDPYRAKMNTDISGMKTFSFEQDVLFEAYVQFDEYVGFVRAMDEFRGMKLVRKFVDKTQAINIGVDFDKSKHLSDAQMQRRERVRKRLIAKAKAEEEEKERQKQLELERVERERQQEEEEKLAQLEKQREREEKRKEKHLKKLQERGQIEISQKIRVEQRKLIIAQRKLESIRILEQLFDRLKIKHIRKRSAAAGSSRHNQNLVAEKERDKLRERLVAKYKIATEKLVNEQRKKVEDIKTNTPISGLLKSKYKSKKVDADDASDDAAGEHKHRSDATADDPAALAASAELRPNAINPFKAAIALAAASANSGAASNDWMKTLPMFPYVPSVFPHHLYRPPAPGYPVPMNYRGGFAPRSRGRGRGRGGRGRGHYDSHESSSYYSNYKHYTKDDDGDSYASDHDDYYKSSSYSRSRNRRYHRSRSRSRSRRSRSRSKSYSRSRSRSRRRHRRSDSRSSSKSRSRSRNRYSHSSSRSRSRDGGRLPLERKSKKLASTLRSRSPSSSDNSSRSRTHRRRSRRRRDSSKSRSRSRNRSRSRSRSAGVKLEPDKLVRSAEAIHRSLEKGLKEQMLQDEREIKNSFRSRHHSDSGNRSKSNSMSVNITSIQATANFEPGSEKNGGNGKEQPENGAYASPRRSREPSVNGDVGRVSAERVRNEREYDDEDDDDDENRRSRSHRRRSRSS